ncbi:MAG: FIG00732228: membrane protein [uncultured Sulfurovum sp.]|uniref:FIG00732228: membrane protein n=1 Tax=uncultured Sulfurovum sp. TaxID=269237 RepID=A0A6S6TPT3_9BACT|nr:MAG: FIG00732228: membrane protein [uncultured Sulfurovum sp.]
MLMASFSFAFMGGAVKILMEDLPALEVTFFRNIFGVIIIGIAIMKTPLVQKGGKPLLLFFRGMMGFLALLAYFYIIKYIPLGEAVTYNKTSPIFVAIFAYIFLNEKLPRMAIGAVVLGFIGIVLIAKPELATGFDRYDMLGIFSGIGAALAYTSIRELRTYYDTRMIVLSFVGIGSIGPIVLMVLAPYVESPELDMLFSEFVMPSGIMWGYIVMVGVLGTFSQILMTKAYEHTKAGIVGAVSYSNIVFALIIGIFLGDAIPDMWTTFGILMVIGSGLLVAFNKEKQV